MLSTKLLASILFILSVVFGQVGNVAAAAQLQETTPIGGTVESITTETDEQGITTVIVKVLDEQGTLQTVRLSVETAVELGLITLDPITQAPVVDETMVGQTVEIDPTTVIPEVEVPVHPLATILASFFGQDPTVVNGYHEEGFGFGVIAQAMWIAQGLGGDASTAGLILEAKETGDYSAFILPDGSTPTNWGQFKKAALGKDKKNLGLIVSGQAEELIPGEGSFPQDHGHGNGRDKDKGKNKNRP